MRSSSDNDDNDNEDAAVSEDNVEIVAQNTTMSCPHHGAIVEIPRDYHY